MEIDTNKSENENVPTSSTESSSQASSSQASSKMNKKIRTIQQFMQFASQIRDFKLNCEHFESAKLIFVKNKNNVLASIKSLKVEFSKLEKQKSQIEQKRNELAELSHLYNFSLIELSLGK